MLIPGFGDAIAKGMERHHISDTILREIA